LNGRLRSVDLALAERLAQLTDHQLRRCAAAAARFAVAQIGLQHAAIAAALEAVDRGLWGDTPVRDAVKSLADQLDVVFWDLGDAAEAGTATGDAVTHAFERARAATSMFFALDANATVAAFEAIYEAHIALGESDSRLHSVLEEAIGV
jgi:hypothetical protein